MLCRRFGLADVYVFGSRSEEVSARVRGEPDSGGVTHVSSDIDIGVQPLPGVSLGADDVVRLAQELECLFGAPRVDLVLLPGSKAFLALDVIRGELLYCSDRDAQGPWTAYSRQGRRRRAFGVQTGGAATRRSWGAQGGRGGAVRQDGGVSKPNSAFLRSCIGS